ncbi:hypothetical protein [Methylacidimicrobium tartarophylax]|uniref:Uncharacterized protein n=1 Tax=Methylacidimicrobium tartarophylax TaxID=1041768 RepID=A0A5E6MG13_9BACT|nr:hypothetical protein [Methylacidimicrobium tartarophylax]VVM08041.1 hypothetical protein MAMT_02077 [Methylacidimicrobium tartarophylax]
MLQRLRSLRCRACVFASIVASFGLLVLATPVCVQGRRAAMTPFLTERLARFLDTLPEGNQLLIRSYLAFDCTHDLVGPSACEKRAFFFVIERGNERRGNLLFVASGKEFRFLHYFSFAAPYAELPKIDLSKEEALCVALLWAQHELRSEGRNALDAMVASSQFHSLPLQRTAYRLLGIACP